MLKALKFWKKGGSSRIAPYEDRSQAGVQRAQDDWIRVLESTPEEDPTRHVRGPAWAGDADEMSARIETLEARLEDQRKQLTEAERRIYVLEMDIHGCRSKNEMLEAQNDELQGRFFELRHTTMMQEVQQKTLYDTALSDLQEARKQADMFRNQRNFLGEALDALERKNTTVEQKKTVEERDALQALVTKQQDTLDFLRGEFMDPISHEPIAECVMVKSGFMYEHASIEAYIKSKNDWNRTDPYTRANMTKPYYFQSHILTNVCRALFDPNFTA